MTNILPTEDEINLIAARSRVVQLETALEAIAAQNGNLPLESLDGTCGPNEGRQRGIQLRNCIEIARANLTHSQPTKETAEA